MPWKIWLPTRLILGILDWKGEVSRLIACNSGCRLRRSQGRLTQHCCCKSAALQPARLLSTGVQMCKLGLRVDLDLLIRKAGKSDSNDCAAVSISRCDDVPSSLVTVAIQMARNWDIAIPQFFSSMSTHKRGQLNLLPRCGCRCRPS